MGTMELLKYNDRGQFKGLLEIDGKYYAYAEIINSDGTKKELIASLDERFLARGYNHQSIQNISFNSEGLFTISFTDEFRNYISRLYEALTRVSSKPSVEIRCFINNNWHNIVRFDGDGGSEIRDYSYEKEFRYSDYFGSFEDFAKAGSLQLEILGLIGPYDSDAGTLLSPHTYPALPLINFSRSGTNISEANIWGFGSGTIRITTKKTTYEKSFDGCSFGIGVPIPYTGAPSNKTYRIHIDGPSTNWSIENRGTDSDAITSYSIDIKYCNSGDYSRECSN